MNTLRQEMIDYFGVYTSPTYQTVVDSQTIDVIPDGLAGVDLVWCSGVLFTLVTWYCILRMMGVVVRGFFDK